MEQGPEFDAYGYLHGAHVCVHAQEGLLCTEPEAEAGSEAIEGRLLSSQARVSDGFSRLYTPLARRAAGATHLVSPPAALADQQCGPRPKLGDAAVTPKRARSHASHRGR